MTLKKPISYLLLLAGLAGTAQAQFLDFGSLRDIDLAPSLEHIPASFRNVEAADLTGNLDAEVVYLFDGGLLVAFDLVTDHSIWRLDIPANDFAIRTKADGTRDLVLAQDTGLKIFDITWDPGQHEADLGTQQHFIGDSAVSNLIDIEQFRFDVVGNEELIGLQDDGRTLVVLLRDTSSDGYSAPLVSPTQTYAPAWKIEPVDLDGDEDDEIAVLSQAGLELYETNGTFLGGHLYSAIKGDITCIQTLNGERIAWLRPTGLGSEVVVVSDADPAAPGSIGVPTQLGESCTSIQAGGQSLGAQASVVVSRAHGLGLLTMTMDDLASQYFNAPTVLHTETATLGSLSAAPLFADLDNDGREDAVWASSIEKSLNVYMNNQWGHFSHLAPEVNYLDFGSVQLDGMVHWKQYGSYSPGDATHLELKVSIQDPRPGTWTDPDPPGEPFATIHGALDPNVRSFDFPLFPAGYSITDPIASYVFARYVRIENGVVVKKYPPIHFVLVRETNLDATTYLSRHYGDELLLISGDDIGNGDAVGGGTPPPPKPPVPPKP